MYSKGKEVLKQFERNTSIDLFLIFFQRSDSISADNISFLLRMAEMLAKSFPNGKIFTFEPNPLTFAKLQDKLVRKATLVNKGLGIQVGELKLFYDKHDQTRKICCKKI